MVLSQVRCGLYFIRHSRGTPLGIESVAMVILSYRAVHLKHLEQQ